MFNQEFKKFNILLASASPRRKELMMGLNIDFEILSGLNYDENFPESLLPDETAKYIARKKAESINPEKNHIYITADTIVSLDGKILNKPADIKQAKQMLLSLSGNQHEVYTGVCIKSAKKQIDFVSGTKVWFSELKANEIDYYLSEYKPLDKAGAYGIQEWIGYIGVEKIEGSYFNVMGLPVQHLYKELINFITIENDY